METVLASPLRLTIASDPPQDAPENPAPENPAPERPPRAATLTSPPTPRVAVGNSAVLIPQRPATASGPLVTPLKYGSISQYEGWRTAPEEDCYSLCFSFCCLKDLYRLVNGTHWR